MPKESRKRKRGHDDNEDDNRDSAKVAVSAKHLDKLGPALGTFLAVKPPPATLFHAFTRKDQQQEGSGEFATVQTLVTAEAGAVEFMSTNQDKDLNNIDYSCQYMVGVFDKSTNELTLRHAPLYIIRHQVKALKSLEPTVESKHDYQRARNVLGEAFGTKKAKAAIRAAEKNKVDVAAMKDVVDTLQSTIQLKTATLPKVEEAKTEADSNRPIPPFNVDASSPSEVYDLGDIAPPAELSTVPTATIFGGEDGKGASLPWSRSQWINRHLDHLKNKPNKADKDKLKVLFYISCMFSFRRAVFRAQDRESLREKMPLVPEKIVDSLIARFTETTRDSNKVQTTTNTEAKLLIYMFALCLRLDNYVTDHAILAVDLAIPNTNITQYFKSLGCVIEKPNATERVRIGVTAEQATVKRAILRVPPTFPPLSKRRGGRK